jgi:integrase
MKATKLKSGKWRINAYAGKDANGKEIRKSFTGTDKKKLQMEAAAFVDEHRLIKDASCDFETAARTFLAMNETVLSVATIRGYNNIVNVITKKHQWFLYQKVYTINSDDLQRLINELVMDDKKPKTVKNYMGFISTVLTANNIRMPIYHLPQKVKPKLHIPTASDVTRTLHAAEDNGNKELWICIMLAATGPLRRGEIPALTMDDIDFRNNVVHVCKSMAYGKDKMWHIKPPKTPSSDRKLVMPKELIGAIEEQGYVTTWTPKQIYNKFKWLLHKYNIEYYRFHDLRHFCVSHLKALGIEDLYIAQRTGHSDYATLRLVYSHTMQDHQMAVDRKIVEEMEKLI